MPPKPMKQQERTRKNATGKSGPKTLQRSIPPSDTWDPASKPYTNDQKAATSFFNRELELKQQEHLKDMRDTMVITKRTEKDSNRLKKRQRFEYGMTLDEIETTRQEIESIKIQNGKLYAEMADSKDLAEKLEKELEDTKRRYADTIEHVKNMKKEAKIWEETKEKLLRTEARAHNLYIANRRLRTVLLRHKIDPNTDAREVHDPGYPDEEESAKSLKSNKTFPRESRRRLTMNGRRDTIEELNLLREQQRKETKKGYGFLDAVFDQMSPAYYGFYTRKKKLKAQQEQKEYIRPGVSLPRVLNVPPLVKGQY